MPDTIEINPVSTADTTKMKLVLGVYQLKCFGTRGSFYNVAVLNKLQYLYAKLIDKLLIH